MSDKKETIFAAIAAAIGEVKQLGKSERNKFDGYDFVSIDKFLSLVNPICATHGLFPMVSQTAAEPYENVNSKGGKSMWARFYFDITLNHKSGDVLGPSKMMVAVPMNGAQASGSAQSYALKQFFRATFMIPTGDKDDADLNPTEHHSMPTEISPKQFTVLRDLVETTDTDATKFLKHFGAASLEQFPPAKYEAATALLALKNREMLKKKQTDTAKAADLGDDEIRY